MRHDPDPFDLLRVLPTPEPDAARIEMVVWHARAAFLAQPDYSDDGGRISWWRSWSRALPVAALGVAALALLVWQPWIAPRSQEPQLADHAAEVGTRFGARAPDLPGAEISGSADNVRQAFGDLVIVTREMPGEVTLALERGGQEIAFDRRVTEEGIALVLLDAVIAPGPDGRQLLLLQSAMADAVNWDAFLIDGERITLAGALSRKVHDAPSRAEAIARLAAP